MPIAMGAAAPIKSGLGASPKSGKRQRNTDEGERSRNTRRCRRNALRCFGRAANFGWIASVFGSATIFAYYLLASMPRAKM